MFTVEVKQLEVNDRIDNLYILRGPNGQEARISGRAGSIEELLLPPGGDDSLIRLVYGHASKLDFFVGRERSNVLPAYTEDYHRQISESRDAGLMQGGVPVTFFPGRVQKGRIRFLQPDYSYAEFDVHPDHPPSDSLLHLGAGKDADFEFNSLKHDENSASIKLTCDIGSKLYGEGFPQKLRAEVEYTLGRDPLKRKVTLFNDSEIYVTIPTSDHSSCMPGSAPLERCSLTMNAIGNYELAEKTKIATGRLIQPARFVRWGGIQLSSEIEEMYRLSPGARDIRMTNEQTGEGLLITVDPKTNMAYVWTHNTTHDTYKHQFCSIQPYGGDPTAIVSAVACNTPQELARMDPLFRQSIKRMMMPHSNISYETEWKAFKRRLAA